MSDERPLPTPDPGTETYWEGTRAHQLRLPHCQDCGQVHFYPRTLCPHCGSARLDWMQGCGRGQVYSFTVVHRPPSSAFKDRVPYVVAIVALEEGPHLMTNIGGCPPDAVCIGMPVEVAWEDIGSAATLPCFVPR
ncbi:MAG: Zn-ribbon domain-containing OB-fold protein [Betaproteobacteria bacterium]|nr:MAG: Zn-ribbon domain-containing OB-fold protein [Betaproteobacteria bacterium]